MAAPRRFDHDEARRLYAEGWSLAQLARRFGVRYQSIKLAVDPAHREQRNNWRREHYLESGRCPECGAPVWGHMRAATSMNGYVRKGRCADCAHRARATSVRPTTLRCHACHEWKTDEEFSPLRAKGKFRRRRHIECKPCAAARRRAERARKRVAA